MKRYLGMCDLKKGQSTTTLGVVERWKGEEYREEVVYRSIGLGNKWG